MSIVYRHRKLNDYKVFYIGIGKNIKRAYSRIINSYAEQNK